MTKLADAHIAGFDASPLAAWPRHEPWQLTHEAEAIVRHLLSGLTDDYRLDDAVAVHVSARIETGATLKGPAIIGPNCLIAAGAYLRGGCWCEAGCVIGPGSEAKSSFLFAGTKLAHFNFVGDSILGRAVNLEAGAIIANHRNEDDHPRIVLIHEGQAIETGASKFGALVGDGVRIGANAVIAPGAILPAGTIVDRLALVDQRRAGADFQAGSRPSGV